MKIYEVGGCIRDKIINKKSNDIDYCVEAQSYQDMKNYIIKNKYIILVENEKFFTIKVKLKEKEYADFTLCRKDGNYSDNRKPDICEISDIKSDLARRDFTINAIAYDIEEKKYIDPFNGISDIKNKIIKCVISTEDRLKEDILRLLRAFRFSLILDFTLDESIINCINNIEYIELLNNISKERIKQELTKCLNFNSYKTFIHLKKFSFLENYILTNFEFKIK